jgi:hypothetical protein
LPPVSNWTVLIRIGGRRRGKTVAREAHGQAAQSALERSELCSPAPSFATAPRDHWSDSPRMPPARPEICTTQAVAASPFRPVSPHPCICVGRSIGIMLRFKLYMIHGEPTISSITIRTPNASAITLLVLSGPGVMWMKKTRRRRSGRSPAPPERSGCWAARPGSSGDEERHDRDHSRQEETDYIA